jgi:hypothetical protein
MVGRSDPDRRRCPWKWRASVRAVVARGKGYGRAARPFAAAVPVENAAGGPSVCSANVPVEKCMVGRRDPSPPPSAGRDMGHGTWHCRWRTFLLAPLGPLESLVPLAFCPWEMAREGAPPCAPSSPVEMCAMPREGRASLSSVALAKEDARPMCPWERRIWFLSAVVHWRDA